MSTQYTRHDKFYHALSEFMDTYTNYLTMLDDSYHKIEDWTITNKTTSPNCNLHVYSLIIPSKCISYIVDVPYRLNGVRHEAGPVYKYNKYVYETIEQQFGFYFNVHHRTNPTNRIISEAYVTMTEKKEKNDMVICKLHVKYNNNYSLPFPVPEEMMSLKEYNLKLRKNIKNYELEVEELEGLYDDLYLKYWKLEQQNAKIMDRLENNNSRMQTRIRELYKSAGVLSDCSVCWEPIKPDTLIVPGCSHFICETCDKKCTRCPMCRENKNPLCST